MIAKSKFTIDRVKKFSSKMQKKKSLRPFWMSETCNHIVHFSFTIWRQKKIMKNKRIFWHDKLKINEFNFLGIWNWCELPGEKIHSVNNRKQVCREKNLKKIAERKINRNKNTNGDKRMSLYENIIFKMIFLLAWK